MKLKAHAFGSSAAFAMAVAYIICAGCSYLWPTFSLKIMGDIAHMTNLDVHMPYFQVTLYNFMSGFTQLVVYTYLYFWSMAKLYNRWA